MTSLSLISAIVLAITDGDTIKVKTERHPQVIVRLACVDSIEKRQPMGKTATTNLAQMIPVGSKVKIKPHTIDRYGRTVAEVFSNSQSVGLNQVNAGYAVVYRVPAYLKHCNVPDLDKAEKYAKLKKLGIWSVNPVCLPSDYRKKLC